MKSCFFSSFFICLLLASGIVIGKSNDNRKFKIVPICTDPVYAEDIGRFGIASFRTDNSGRRIVIEWTAHDKDGLLVDKGTTTLSNCVIDDLDNWKCRNEVIGNTDDRLISVSEMKGGKYKYTGFSSNTKTCTATGTEIK